MKNELIRNRLVPTELSTSLSRMPQLPANREVDAFQEREYQIDAANGDRIVIQERTTVRIREVQE